MSVKDEILQDLENKLVSLGDKFGEYVNTELFTKSVEIDEDDVENNMSSETTPEENNKE